MWNRKSSKKIVHLSGYSHCQFKPILPKLAENGKSIHLLYLPWTPHLPFKTSRHCTWQLWYQTTAYPIVFTNPIIQFHPSEISPMIQLYLPAFSLSFPHTIPSLTVVFLYFLSRSLFNRFLIIYHFPLILVMLLFHILSNIFKTFILLHTSWSFFINHSYFFEQLLSCQKFIFPLLLFQSFSQCQSLFKSLSFSEKSSAVSHTSFSKDF